MSEPRPAPTRPDPLPLPVVDNHAHLDIRRDDDAAGAGQDLAAHVARLVADAPEGLPEAEWAGSTVALGHSARLHVVMKTVRCVVPSRQHDGLPLEKGLTRAVATVGGRYLGAYADIARTGRITVGDPIRVTGPREPGRLGKAAATARTATLDTLNRLAELPRRGRHPVG